jgi:hypothetical protein
VTTVAIRTATASARQEARFTPALIVLIFLAAIAPAVAAPVLPAIDFYSHIARYFVLAHLSEDPFLAENYQAAWAVLPNIGMDILGVGLMRLLPAMLAVKVIVVIVFAVQYFGLLAFTRALNGRVSLLNALLAVPLLYSFILTWGFTNFLLGLGLVFWAAAWWLWQRRRPALAIPVACLLAIGIFLCHGFAFALYGVLLGGLELGHFLAARPRRPRQLLLRMSALAVQAVIPAILFLLSPTGEGEVTNAVGAVQRLSAAGQLMHRLQELFVYRLATIVRVSESPWLWLDVVSFLVVAVLIAILVLRGRLKLPVVVYPALAILAVLAVIVPPAMFGVGYVSDRIPLLIAFLLAGSVVLSAPRDRLDRACLAGLLAVVATRLLATGLGWQAYQAELADLHTLARLIPSHSLVAYLDAADGERLDAHRRCEMYGPLLAPQTDNAVSLFAYKSQQPIALKGRLKAAVEAQPPADPDLPVGVRVAGQFNGIARAARFQYALVCAPERIAGPAPPGARLIGRQGRLALYRLEPGAPS